MISKRKNRNKNKYWDKGPKIPKDPRDVEVDNTSSLRKCSLKNWFTILRYYGNLQKGEIKRGLCVLDNVCFYRPQEYEWLRVRIDYSDTKYLGHDFQGYNITDFQNQNVFYDSFKPVLERLGVGEDLTNPFSVRTLNGLLFPCDIYSGKYTARGQVVEVFDEVIKELFLDNNALKGTDINFNIGPTGISDLYYTILHLCTKRIRDNVNGHLLRAGNFNAYTQEFSRMLKELSISQSALNNTPVCYYLSQDGYLLPLTRSMVGTEVSKRVQKKLNGTFPQEVNERYCKNVEKALKNTYEAAIHYEKFFGKVNECIGAIYQINHRIFDSSNTKLLHQPLRQRNMYIEDQFTSCKEYCQTLLYALKAEYQFTDAVISYAIKKGRESAKVNTSVIRFVDKQTHVSDLSPRDLFRNLHYIISQWDNKVRESEKLKILMEAYDHLGRGLKLLQSRVYQVQDLLLPAIEEVDREVLRGLGPCSNFKNYLEGVYRFMERKGYERFLVRLACETYPDFKVKKYYSRMRNRHWPVPQKEKPNQKESIALLRYLIIRPKPVKITIPKY